MNDQETILAYLATCWPEGASLAKILKNSGAKGRPAENAASALVTSGRVTSSLHSYYSILRLTHDEAEAQGCDMRPKVPGRTDRLDARPLYVPKPMQPARYDAEQAMQVMSRDGDKRLPFARPISMVSTVRGGA